MTQSFSSTKERVSVPKMEYLRLKKLDERFGGFWLYMEHLLDIVQARGQVKKKEVISQEKLFRKLGF